MDSSKPWMTAVRLGQQIVEELGLEDSVDTLGRWMAHRVAELMQRAEQAETQADCEIAQKECSELILKIWDRRSTLLDNRPLAEIADFLETFTGDSPTTYHTKTESDEKTWLSILPILNALQEREDKVCRDAAIADIPRAILEQEHEWLTQDSDAISPEEARTIKLLWERYEQLSGDHYTLDQIKAPNFVTLPAHERTKLICEALAKIEDERKVLLMSIESLKTDNQD
jgi:predicted Zn-dependent protease with MMP-like domain